MGVTSIFPVHFAPANLSFLFPLVMISWDILCKLPDFPPISQCIVPNFTRFRFGNPIGMVKAGKDFTGFAELADGLA